MKARRYQLLFKVMAVMLFGAFICLAGHGPEKTNRNLAKFILEDILSDKVILAYRVNDQVLPRQHEFPLRLVTEEYICC